METLIPVIAKSATMLGISKFKLPPKNAEFIYICIKAVIRFIPEHIGLTTIILAGFCAVIVGVVWGIRNFMYETISCGTVGIIRQLLDPQENNLRNMMMYNSYSLQDNVKYYFKRNGNKGYVIRPNYDSYGEYRYTIKLSRTSKQNITDFWKDLKAEYDKQEPPIKSYIRVCRYITEQQSKISTYENNGSDEEREAILRKTFFHENRDMIINKCKTIMHKAEILKEYQQSLALNLLLYGPPGTGKTALAIHLARLFGKNLIIMRFTEKTTKEFFYNRMASGGIILFDEIDIGIRKLQEKELHAHDKANLKKAMLRERLRKSNRQSSGTSFGGGNVPAKKIKKPKVELADLIEIFQSVETNTRICIATTNDFEEIQKICPKLFRYGRLTPIYFGYLTHKELEELSLAYYGVGISLPEKIVIERPTSEIMAKAIDLRVDDDLSNEERARQFQEYIMTDVVCK